MSHSQILQQNCHKYLLEDETTKSIEERAEFAMHVKEGLTRSQKSLSSKYFYDDAGSELFQQIMNLEEYYLTNCEKEVLEDHSATMLQIVSDPFLSIIELGAGDGVKSKILLNTFLRYHQKFDYTAIDISAKALEELRIAFNEFEKSFEICLLKGDYLKNLRALKEDIKGRKLVMFLGSNIGNFGPEESIEFLTAIKESLKKGDYFLIGYDLMKDPDVILKAYNDSKGVTSRFNLNLLERINRELGGAFDIHHFEHFPEYDSVRQEARSYIRSLTDQQVTIQHLKTTINFSEGELIHTEISRKYSIDQMEGMAQRSGFKVLANFYDSKKYFCDGLWVVE